MLLQDGHVIDGKYRIVRVIGEGGMGAVYEGENLRIKRRVAIKLLHAGVASNVEMVQRFEREAQVAGTVGNDHILEILDLGALPGGERYMVMEFLDGETLTDRIKAAGRLHAPDAVSLLRQVLQGLAAAHAAGIVHRDLKPDNIFILKEKAGVRDYVKIIDFGISKFTDQGGSSSRMTRTGALMGTPHYMAPEQATGSSEIDRRTDIYAVGIILYEALTGRVPFQAETFNQLLFEIALAKIIPARQIVPDLDEAIDSIIMKASARDPAHRFQTCAEFSQALDQWERTGSAVSLPPEQTLEAIVAATVPRAAPSPSFGPDDSTLPEVAAAGPGDAAVPIGSVGGMSATAVSAAPPAASVASAPARPPTVSTWANSSQSSVPKSGGPPIVAATALGVLLLVGGGTGAYLMMKPSAPAIGPTPSGALALTAPSVEAPASPPAVVPAAASPAAPAPSAEAPAAKPPAAAVKPPAVAAKPPVASVAPHASVHVASTQKPVDKAEKPKPAKKTFNFGY